jgi:hypothetical protein
MGIEREEESSATERGSDDDASGVNRGGCAEALIIGLAIAAVCLYEFAGFLVGGEIFLAAKWLAGGVAVLASTFLISMTWGFIARRQIPLLSPIARFLPERLEWLEQGIGIEGAPLIFVAAVVMPFVPRLLGRGYQGELLLQVTGGTVVLLRAIWTSRGRRKLYGSSPTWVGTIGYLVVVGSLSLSIFSLWTYYFWASGYVHVESPASPEAYTFAAYFLWSFASAVPLLEINQTLHWRAPISYP